MIDTGIAKPAFRRSGVFAPDGRFQINRDETWLPEWSGNLGGVQRWRSSVA
jgi:hypothetical protein